MKKFLVDWALYYQFEVEAENEEQAKDIIWNATESIGSEPIGIDCVSFVSGYDEINEINEVK